MTNKHGSYNPIEKLQVNQVITEDQDDIKTDDSRILQNYIQTESEWRLYIYIEDTPKITEEESEQLQ